ncbi:hypothetical protein PN491_20110, partial [Dolichospermum circinale CS-539/09]|nr:hypothetical protein [Dolichospermum circinale CS-539/09]
VSGQWSVVSCQLSVVSGQWSVVSCQLSGVMGNYCYLLPITYYPLPITYTILILFFPSPLSSFLM